MFIWCDNVETSFIQSKTAIIESIKEGNEIFNIGWWTCLRPDWHWIFMSQKHCDCPSLSQGCYNHGWHIIQAGFCFFQSAKTQYVPVEGEALAIAWSFKQTKTLGHDNPIVTNQEPMTKLFVDRTLDEISNPWLFRVKQFTLLWRSDTKYMPGNDNHFSDAWFFRLFNC